MLMLLILNADDDDADNDAANDADNDADNELTFQPWESFSGQPCQGSWPFSLSSCSL